MRSEELTKTVKESGLISADASFTITPFVNSEDGEEYSVWLVSSGECRFVLKKAKGQELSIYKTYLSGILDVPRLLRAAGDYLFLEYIEGKQLFKLTKKDITLVIDALINVQSRYWQADEKRIGISFEKSLESRIERGKFLCDADLEAEYEKFIELYKSIPRTLCHDDLLPFNAIIQENEEKAVIIDWEFAGILPYPTSLARLIAHTKESENAFFFMREEDKEFAILYYFDNFIKDKGIPFSEYKKAVDLFIFYEYCEWIMLGNKCSDADMVRFEEYKQKAKKHINKGAKNGAQEN